MGARRLGFSCTLFLCSSLLVTSLTFAQTAPQKPTPKSTAKPGAPAAAPDAQIPSPVSRHYPILIIAHGNEPFWSLRLGMKGPERLDRAGYPPIILDPGEITPDDSGNAWTYRAKDDATNADVAVRVSREACSDNMADMKYTFKIVVEHAQIGSLNGCGQSAPEKFPEFRKKNQLDMPDDAEDKDKAKESDKDKEKDKKTAVLDPITNFHSPVSFAYLDGAGRVIFTRRAAKRTVASAGSELAVSHDGKKLLYTRSDSKTGPERSIVLYDFDTGRSLDLASGNARSAFWSPDDTRVAFLKYDGKLWQVWTLPVAAPANAALFSPQVVDSLHGWTSPNTVLATDMQNAWWLSEDKPPQSTPLKDIYGETFEIMSSDSLRPNPINSDLLLVSAYYLHTPAGAPTDSIGLNSSFFLYEVRSHRRTILGTPDTFARAAEWSRDGLQIFFTRGVAGKNVLGTSRVFWDSTGLKPYSAGSYLVVGK